LNHHKLTLQDSVFFEGMPGPNHIPLPYTEKLYHFV
jgi:hypothetical protein